MHFHPQEQQQDFKVIHTQLLWIPFGALNSLPPLSSSLLLKWSKKGFFGGVGLGWALLMPRWHYFHVHSQSKKGKQLLFFLFPSLL